MLYLSNLVKSILWSERRTAKAHRPKTNALPLDHATNRRRSKAKKGVKREMAKEAWKGKVAREAEEKDKGVRTIQQELTQQLRGHAGWAGELHPPLR